MDRAAAATVAEDILAELRALPYASLRDRFLDEIETRLVTHPSGVEYQAEIHGLREPGQPANLCIVVGVDDGSFRGAFSPVTRTFVIAPDGSFMGE